MTAQLVGVETSVVSDEPITADMVTDLIEIVVDHLDEAGMIPSVSTTGIGDEVKLLVEVVVEGDGLEGFAAGVAAIDGALTAAGFADALGGGEARSRPLAVT